MKISIGNDHSGTVYKELITFHLKNNDVEVINRGTNSNDNVDYPDFAHTVSRDVETRASDKGILICGSGNGMVITANKHKGIRAGLCWNSEISELIRKHNDANILCIPARFLNRDQVLEIVDKFINTPFEKGRHVNRINKIENGF